MTGERELAEPRDLFRLLVEATRDYAIFALDPDGYVLTWNPGAQRFKGYTPDEIIGRHFSIFYPQEAIDRGHPQYELEVAKREGRFEEEGWRLRKDGSRFWASVVLTALHDEGGRLIGYGKVTRDLSERQLAQQRAIEDARRVAEAEAANRAKAEFLAAMSHELRTPLNAISGYVELLEAGLRGPLNEKQIEDLRRIRRSSQHLLGIINDLLNFSRLEAGTVSYDIRPFSAAALMEGVHVLVEPLANAKRVELSFPAPDPALMLRADAARVEQILVNLIGNAIKFTPSGGNVNAQAREGTEGDVLIVVRDTGIGIPPAQLQAIFEPFVQVGRPLTGRPDGTGLGLSISRDLARAMNGDLSADSEEGRGSTFTLRLPAA